MSHVMLHRKCMQQSNYTLLVLMPKEQITTAIFNKIASHSILFSACVQDSADPISLSLKWSNDLDSQSESNSVK